MPPGGEPAAVGESAGEQAPAIRTSVVSIFESVKNKRASIVVADGSADGNASPVAPANARASAEDQDEGKIQSSADNEFGGGADDGSDTARGQVHVEEEGDAASDDVPAVKVEATTYPLPPGWKKLRIAEDAAEYAGFVYYLNERTMETQWEPPPDPALAVARASLLVQQRKMEDEEQKVRTKHHAFGSTHQPKVLVFKHKLADVEINPTVSAGMKATVVPDGESGDDDEEEEDAGSIDVEPRLSVVSVTRGGQFGEAGVKAGDRIVSVAGQHVATVDDFKEYMRIARSHDLSTVAVRIKRDNSWATSRHLGGSAVADRLYSAVTLSTQRSQYRGRLRRIEGGANSSGGRKMHERKKRGAAGASAGASSGAVRALAGGPGQTEWNGKFYLEHSIASNPFEQSFQTFEAKVDKSLSVSVPIVTADVDQVAFTEGVPTGKTLRPGQRFHFKATRSVSHMHEDGNEYGVTMYELVWGESCWVHDFNAARPGERTIKAETIIFSVAFDKVVERPRLRGNKDGRRRASTVAHFEGANPMVPELDDEQDGGEEDEEEEANEGGEEGQQQQQQQQQQEEEEGGGDADEEEGTPEVGGDGPHDLVGFAGEVVVRAPLELGDVPVGPSSFEQMSAAAVPEQQQQQQQQQSGEGTSLPMRPNTAPAALSLLSSGRKSSQFVSLPQLSVVEFEPDGQFALAGGKRGDRIVAVNGRIVATGDQLVEALESSRLLGDREIVVEVKKVKKWDRTSTERLYADHKVRDQRRQQLATKHHPTISFKPALEGGLSAKICRNKGQDEVFHRLWQHAEQTKRSKVQQSDDPGTQRKGRTNRRREDPEVAKRRKEKIMKKSQALYKAGVKRQEYRRNWEEPPPGKECTFAPNLEKTKKAKGARSTNAVSEENGEETPVHLRLYDHRKQVKEKMQVLLDKKEAKFNMEHTFQPQMFSARSGYSDDGEEEEGEEENEYGDENASTGKSVRSALSTTSRSASSLNDGGIESY